MRTPDGRTETLLEKTIFASRWLQAPLYIGLIVAQGIYVYQFFVELWHLLGLALHGVPAGGPDTSTTIMLMVLGLIDVVMIANLLGWSSSAATRRSSHGSTSTTTPTSRNGSAT